MPGSARRLHKHRVFRTRVARKLSLSRDLSLVWRTLNIGRDNKAIVMARSGAIANANPRACALLERTLERLVGERIDDFFEDRPTPKKHGTPQMWEAQLTLGSASNVPVEVTCDDLGSGLRAYAIRDLRQQREAAQERARQTAALRERDDQLHSERLRLEGALASLSQGVCVFDGEQRLVMCNEPYLRIYELSPQQAQPGTHLRDILEHRAKNGFYLGASREVFIQQRLAVIASRRAVRVTHSFPNGRIVEVRLHPIASGGWIATHEDITERQSLEALLKQQNEQLRTQGHELKVRNLHFDAALRNMSQGLCMFDGQGRLVLCNEQYREMYQLTSNEVAPGTPFRQLLHHRAARGSFPKGRTPDAYITELRRCLERDTEWSAATELHDGRVIAVANRRMADGGWLATHQDVTGLREAERGLVTARTAAENAAKQARAAHSALLDAFEVVPEGLVLFDADDRYVLWNKSYEQMYGGAKDKIKRGMRFEDVLRAGLERGHYPDAYGQEEQWLADRLARHKQPKNSHEQRLANGRWVRIEEHRTSNGGSIGVRVDITTLKQREQELSTRNMLLDAALNNMSQGLVLFDRNRRVVICNRRYMDIYGLTEAQVRPGTLCSKLIEHRLSLGLKVAGERDTYVRQRLEGPVTAANAYHEFADGRVIAYAVRPMPDGGGVATHEDVTEQRRSEARIAHMAHHDALTDLPNRVLLRQKLEEALVQAGSRKSVAVLWLDLDRFKDVNDTLGHNVGDALLKIVAERLRGCIRGNDTIARLGGDEFAIVQTDTDQPYGATALAIRLIKELGTAYLIDGHQVVVGASVGISLYPSDATDVDQLLKNADLALYRAKAEGRGTYRFFEPEMDARMHARRQLELDLRQALEQGSFELHYQPIFDLENNVVTTLEALLRWNHPIRGWIPPVEFIPLAEETGLIEALGAWVLRTACAQATSWPAEIKVAVNLSPLQFNQDDLVERVFSALATSSLPPGRLELEITESTLLQDTDRVLGMLHRLRDLGVWISMDDFGTGYSSLKNLRSFPFNKIKVDQSFIQGLGEDQQCFAIVQAIAGLGAGLDMITTAEGVETVDQLQWVRSLGIDEVQGFYLSKPIPAQDIKNALIDLGRKARVAA